MQEILFRAKALGEGAGWVEGYPLPQRTSGDWTIQDRNGVGYDVLPATLGQYIGHTDKNGTRIFTGDIVEIPTGARFVVVFSERDCAFGRVNITEYGFKYERYFTDTIDRYWWSENFSLEVIGNVFDNKELLPCSRV